MATLSEALNLYFSWEDQHHSHVRLLRPYLPDGTPITTSMEEHRLRVEEQRLRVEAEDQRDAAERLAAEETQRRREMELELERLHAQLAHQRDNDL